MYRRAACGKQCRMARWLLVLGISLWVPSAGPANAQDDSPLRKRFFAEAPKAWKRHEAFWATLEGTSKGERRERRDDKWINSPARQFWKQCNGNYLNQVESLESGVWRGSIRGENSEYIFVLVRDSEDKPWVIQDVKKK